MQVNLRYALESLNAAQDRLGIHAVTFSSDMFHLMLPPTNACV